MKKLSFFLIVFLIIILTFIAYGSYKYHGYSLSREEKIEDAEVLVDFLDKSYPFWIDFENKGLNKDEFLEKYKQILINTKTDRDFFNKLVLMTKELNYYGHFFIFHEEELNYFYSKISVNSIGELPAVEFSGIESGVRIILSDNVKNAYEDRLFFSKIKSFFTRFSSKKIDNKSLYESSINFYDEEKISYIKVPSMMNFNQTRSVIYKSLKDISNTEHLIIDVRGNGGGLNRVWKELLVAPFIEEKLVSHTYGLYNSNSLIDINGKEMNKEVFNKKDLPELDEKVFDYFDSYIRSSYMVKPEFDGYDGQIWILVDDGCYSACDIFTKFAKSTEFATIVGKNTGGDGAIMLNYFFLPKSNYGFRMSYYYTLNLEGAGNEDYGERPHIIIGDDENALEVVLELIREQ